MTRRHDKTLSNINIDVKRRVSRRKKGEIRERQSGGGGEAEEEANVANAPILN